jgi:RimJ/RimL family protein N-acetyltransferase
MVTLDDLDLIFNWANNPEVRKNAFNMDQIKYEDHLLWFKKKLRSKSSYIYILEKTNIPIGQIRFDFEDNTNCIIISYSISEEHKKNGYGSKIIELGLHQLKKINMGSDKVFASVKINNIASIKCFEKNNFKKTFEDNYQLHFELNLSDIK